MCLMLTAVLTIHAQTIRENDAFWDGYTQWQVAEIYGGKTVRMVNTEGETISLQAIDDRKGWYTLVPSCQADEPVSPYTQFGWKVQYVRQEGMYYLAIRRPNGDTMWSMVLTPDRLEDLQAQQREMAARTDYISSVMLLNRNYLAGIKSKRELRLMRNEILARHGYVFQSKELQSLFSAKSWYRPAKSNKSIRLSVIEQHNLELIKSEEASRNGEL